MSYQSPDRLSISSLCNDPPDPSSSPSPSASASGTSNESAGSTTSQPISPKASSFSARKNKGQLALGLGAGSVSPFDPTIQGFSGEKGDGRGGAKDGMKDSGSAMMEDDDIRMAVSALGSMRSGGMMGFASPPGTARNLDEVSGASPFQRGHQNNHHHHEDRQYHPYSKPNTYSYARVQAQDATASRSGFLPLLPLSEKELKGGGPSTTSSFPPAQQQQQQPAAALGSVTSPHVILNQNHYSIPFPSGTNPMSMATSSVSVDARTTPVQTPVTSSASATSTTTSSPNSSVYLQGGEIGVSGAGGGFTVSGGGEDIISRGYPLSRSITIDSTSSMTSLNPSLSSEPTSVSSPTSTSTQDASILPTNLTTPTVGAGAQHPSSSPEAFLTRVSNIPLVNNALHFYSQGKASSRVVKYGAEFVENGVQRIGNGVVGGLGKVGLGGIAEAGVEGLDGFACRQLDRFGKRYPSFSGSPQGEDSPDKLDAAGAATYNRYRGIDEDEEDGEDEYEMDDDEFRRGRGRQREIERVRKGKAKAGFTGAESSMVRRTSSMSSSNDRSSSMMSNDDQSTTGSSSNRQVQVVPNGNRSRWQALVVEAGVTAGGIGLAVSEESMKSLKYCLQWLQYATANLDHQITVLRDFIASLNHPESVASDALITSGAAHTLTRIKHDVVETIRKVVEVVSKYAGASLPEHAKRFVRQSILSLPVKWASAIQSGNGVRGGVVPGLERSSSVAPSETDSTASTPMPMSPRTGGFDSSSGPSLPSLHRGVGSGSGSAAYFGTSPASSTFSAEHSTSASASSSSALSRHQEHVRSTTQEAAERVLTFAVESLDMLKGVTQIFGESVDRAEAWIERLRIVGLAQQRRREEAEAESTPEDTPVGSTSGVKRRRGPRTDKNMNGQAEGSGLLGREGDDGNMMDDNENEELRDEGEGRARRRKSRLPTGMDVDQS